MELGGLKDNELRELATHSAALQVTSACLCALLAVAKISFGKDRTLCLPSSELEHLMEQVPDLPKPAGPQLSLSRCRAHAKLLLIVTAV